MWGPAETDWDQCVCCDTKYVTRIFTVRSANERHETWRTIQSAPTAIIQRNNENQKTRKHSQPWHDSVTDSCIIYYIQSAAASCAGAMRNKTSSKSSSLRRCAAPTSALGRCLVSRFNTLYESSRYNKNVQGANNQNIKCSGNEYIISTQLIKWISIQYSWFRFCNAR